MRRAKTPDVLTRSGRAVYILIKNYITIVRGRAEGAGVSTLLNIIKGGPLNWLGLVFILICVISTAYIGIQSQRFLILTTEIWLGETINLPLPALYISLLISSIGWSYLLVGAASLGLGMYVFVAAYVSYFGLYVGLNLAGTPWFILIPIWLLVIGCWVASKRYGRWRLPLLLLLGQLVALLTYNSLGLKTILPSTWGQPILGAIYFVLIANPFALKQRSLKSFPVFLVSFTLFTILYILSLMQSPNEVVFGNLFLAFHGLLGVIGFFWYFVGLDLTNGAQDLAKWLTVSLKSLFPQKFLVGKIFFIWGIWIVVAYLLVHGFPIQLALALQNYHWGDTILRAFLSIKPSLVLESTLEVFLFLMVAIIFVTYLIWRIGKISLDRILTIFYLSLVGFFTLWCYFGLFYAFSSGNMVKSLGFWPLLIFISGMIWETIKVSSGFNSQTPSRSWLFLGSLLLLSSISLLELSAGYPYFGLTLSLNTFVGFLYLGLPYFLYVTYSRNKHTSPVSSRRILLLFFLGMLSAIPSLILQWSFTAPLLWLVIILVAGKYSWSLENWVNGVVYSISLAMGFIIFYTHPIQIPVPAFTNFMGNFLELQNSYAGMIIWPWEVKWWLIVLGSIGAAIILGFLLSLSHAARGWLRILWLIICAILSPSFLLVYELVLLHPH